MKDKNLLYEVKGLQDISFVDYPKKISSVVFLGGCNLRCSYCHNMKNLEKASIISIEEVLQRIGRVEDKIDGIVITGGEPLFSEIFTLIEKLKNRFQKSIKVDTNGTFPEKLKDLLESKMIDFVAMDIKLMPRNYHLLGASGEDVKNILKSIEIIKNSGISHHFRTTLAECVTKEDLAWIKIIVEKSSWKIQAKI